MLQAPLFDGLSFDPFALFAPGLDQPIVWYEGTTVDSTTRRFLSSDERAVILARL